MITVITIVFAICFLACWLAVMRYDIQMFQQNSYRPERFIPWAKEHILGHWRWVMLAVVIFASGRWPEKIKMGKMRWPMIFYLSSIFMHGITGLALMIMLPGTNYAMLGLGSFLFMISDIDLNVYRFIFNNNKWLIRFNSLTYFVGLLLIVLSTVYA